MSGALQLLGAVAVLIPFVASQLGWMSARSVLYLVLNLAGSSVLAVLALADDQWGFLLLEAVWALVAAWSLVRRRPEA